MTNQATPETPPPAKVPNRYRRLALDALATTLSASSLVLDIAGEHTLAEAARITAFGLRGLNTILDTRTTT